MGEPTVGITMGDAAGVGPEIVLKAHGSELVAACRPVVVGDARVLGDAAERLGLPVDVRRVASPAEASPRPGGLDVIDLGNLAPGEFTIGEVNASCGRASVEYIQRATTLALAGELDAIASAPTS